MGRLTFSANLGFLWRDLSLPAAIHAAAAAGFDAVECHFPYDHDPGDVAEALKSTGLPMLGLNTWPGDRSAGDFGLAALPGREAVARRAIDQAVAYAAAVRAQNVHVMAGKSRGDDARGIFVDALSYACELAARHGVTILIEPLNHHDVPEYHLTWMSDAAEVIAAVGAPNLKIMFDCYHVARMEQDVLSELTTHIDLVGHIQFAGVPGRGRPDVGTLDYEEVFRGIAATGWGRPLGAEYLPGAPTEETLSWMAQYDAI